jgi:hypothetical protein
MLEGNKSKSFEFAPTGFVRDGRSKDYLKLLIEDGKLGSSILLATVLVIIAALAAGVLSAGAAAALVAFAAGWKAGINGKSNTLINEFVENDTYSGAVRLTSEQTLAPRLILWDGASKGRAKAYEQGTLPTPNTFYNPTSVPYDEKIKLTSIIPATCFTITRFISMGTLPETF